MLQPVCKVPVASFGPAGRRPFIGTRALRSDACQVGYRSRLSSVVAVLLLAGCGGGGAPGGECRSRGSAPRSSCRAPGASFPAPLYNKWFKAYSARPPERAGRLSVGRQRRRRQERDRPHRRLRRQRRGDEAGRHGQGRRRRAAVSDDRRQHRARLQPPGRRQSEAVAQGLRGHLPRHGQALERSGDRRGQSRREAARPADQRRRARRQQRHVVRVLAST